MKMLVVAILAVGLVGVVSAASRRRAPAPQSQSKATGEEPTVLMQIVAQRQSAAGGHWFELRYEDRRGTTRFALELQAIDHQPSEDNPFSLTVGALHRVAASQRGPLLNALARLHGAPPPVGLTDTRDRVAISVVILAARAAIAPRDWNVAGRYSTKQTGKWLVTKLFVPVRAGTAADPDAEDTCEIFLAINSVDKVGEFSVKDTDYWPPLAAALSQVF